MELTGERFGHLTVLKLVGGPRIRWLCDCDCGGVKVAAQRELLAGDTKSCGCRKRDVMVSRNTTHGKTNTYTYSKWRGMHARVRDTSSERNACYKGVTICSEWHRFEQFYLDMGEAPAGYSLDRIDNTKGYARDNCRWVPLALQAANTSRNVVVTFEGVTTHVSEHARQRHLEPDVVFDRINKLGWTVERALATPKLPQGSGSKTQRKNL